MQVPAMVWWPLEGRARGVLSSWLHWATEHAGLGGLRLHQATGR